MIWALFEESHVFQSIEREIRDLVDSAVERAKNAPEPSPDQLTTDVYLNDDVSIRLAEGTWTKEFA